MNKELLHLFKKHTDTLFEQTRTRPQKTLEYILNTDSMNQASFASKHIKTFSLTPPKNLSQEGKWLLAVKVFEATNSAFFPKMMKTIVFQLQHQAIGLPEGVHTLLPTKLQKLLRLISQNDFELHVN